MNPSEIVNALEAILTSLGSGLFSPLPVRRAVAEERALIARLKAEPKEKRLAEGWAAKDNPYKVRTPKGARDDIPIRIVEVP